MKRKVMMALAVLVAFACLTAIVVTAVSDTATENTVAAEIQRIPVNSDKVYYAYYNSGSGKGAVAFCLNNEFVSYGTSETPLKLCVINPEGKYETLYDIPRDKVGTWFYGKTEFSAPTCDEVKNFLGGLSGIGITVDSEKVNLAFELSSQPISPSTVYYIYIPEDYFLDGNGQGNMAAYVEVAAEKVNGYTGNLLEDLQTATEGIYDLALFGVESVLGVLS